MEGPVNQTARQVGGIEASIEAIVAPAACR
jgi:hypothetical protein